MPFQDALEFLLTAGFPTFLVVAGVPLLLWYAAGKPKKRWPYAVALGLAIGTLLTHEGGEIALGWFQRNGTGTDLTQLTWLEPGTLARLRVRLWGVGAGLMVALGAIWIQSK